MLGFAARERVLELLAERTAGPEEQRLNGTLREVEGPPDLGVRVAVYLAHDKCCALVEREPRERDRQFIQGVRLVFDKTGVGMVVVERHDARPPRGLAETLP